MTTLELARPLGHSLFDARGGEVTLDDAVVGAWEGLATPRIVACLLCGGEMSPSDGRGGELSGECGDCGSVLA